MPRTALVILLVLCATCITICMFSACFSGHLLPFDRRAYVGTYLYKSVDTSVDESSDHELDRLVLEADGHYWLRQGRSTKARIDRKGIWTFVPGEYPNIVLDHAGYPIEIKQGKIRLVINYDLGEWYAKKE